MARRCAAGRRRAFGQRLRLDSLPDDYETHWKHNGCWLFDDPQIMRDIARAEHIDLSSMTLFYYERLDEEFDETARAWSPIPPPPEPVNVTPPARKTLRGYDVSCASQGNAPECLPLSCNALCTEARVNAHCLFDTVEEAKEALERGCSTRASPGRSAFSRCIR